MTRKKTNAEFVTQVKELVGDEYTFLEPYQGNRVKIYVRHNKCGYTYPVVPDSFLRGRRCPRCSRRKLGKSRRLTNEEFINRVKKAVGDEYTFLEPYKTSQLPILVRHNKCGHIMKMRPINFLNGARCKYCAHNVKLNTAEFVARIKRAYGNDYTVLGQYINSETLILVRHNVCGNEYRVRPMSILRGQRCPKCFKTLKKTAVQFQDELNKKYGKDVYTVLGQYINAKTKISIRHNKCGYIWKTKPNWILTRTSGCPFCNTSHGEKIIIKILKDNEIIYEYPKKFKDLRGEHSLLHYDFYISDQKVLIEYQGKQHYVPVDYFGGIKQLHTQQKHDQMKRDYAKKHGYRLIEIPYTINTEEDIEKCLRDNGVLD